MYDDPDLYSQAFKKSYRDKYCDDSDLFSLAIEKSYMDKDDAQFHLQLLQNVTNGSLIDDSLFLQNVNNIVKMSDYVLNIDDNKNVLCLCLGIENLGIFALKFGSLNEFLFERYHSKLMNLISDQKMSLSIRTECATTLGIYGLINFCTPTVKKILDCFTGVIKNSFPKEPVATLKLGSKLEPNLEFFWVTLLKSWSLMLTVLPDSKCFYFDEEFLHQIYDLLESSNLNLKIAAAKAVSVFFEKFIAVESKSPFIEIDSIKMNVKQETTANNENLHILLKDIIDGGPLELIKIDHGGFQLKFNTWSVKCQFDFLTSVIGIGGFRINLWHNPLFWKLFNRCEKLKTARAKSVITKRRLLKKGLQEISLLMQLNP